MTYEERRTAIVRDVPEPTQPRLRRVEPGLVEAERQVVERQVVESRPAGTTIAARIVVLLFGLVQILVALRIVLLLLDARESNDLVAAILSLSRPFVAPFEGILRSDALGSGGAVLDLAAIVALVGWTIVELIVLAIVRVGQRDPAV